MQELQKTRSYLLLLVCTLGLPFVLAQGTADIFNTGTNAQLLQSFQNEMKSLEAAAHRVNTLLMNPSLGNAEIKQAEDQVAENTEAKPSQNQAEVVENKPFDFTVLANPSLIRTGFLKMKTPEPTTTTTESTTEVADKQTFDTNNPLFNFGPFGSLFNTFTNRVNIQSPWWRGKNVCVQKSDDTDDKETPSEARNLDRQFFIFGSGSFERCTQTANKYVCTTVMSTPESSRTTTVTYECCEGFRREGNACVEVNLKSLVETLEDVGAGEFGSIIKASGMLESLASRNVTVFAPIDEAMGKHQQQPQMSNEVSPVRPRRAIEEMWNSVNPFSADFNSNMQELVSSHITDSLLEVEDFSNEMLVNSSNGDSVLRINVYPGRQDPVITVNCARLTSWDNWAKHSRIHTIDKVISPATQSVLDILQQPQFSKFKNYLDQAGLLSKIENSSAITVFAPTNDAWGQLDETLRTKYDKGEGCIDAVLKHHILPLTLCSAPTSEGRLTTTDLAGEFIRISTNEEGEMIVDKKTKVVQKDNIAINGVVHIVDNIMIPQSAKSVSDLLQYSNHTTFLDLLNIAGITDEINKANNLTLFVPTEKVLNEPETKEMLANMDFNTLKEVLMYHAATIKNPTCDMKDDSELDTMLEGAKLRINTYDSEFIPFFTGMDSRATVQCASLLHTDGKACHAVAHEVDRVLLPPQGSILKLIADNPELSTLKKVIEGTEVEKDLEYQKEQQSSNSSAGYTLLAPNNEAFSRINEQKLNKLMTDKKFADQIIRKHILQDPMCCSGISTSPWPFTHSVKTLQGRKLEVNRNRNNQVLFGNSVAVKCDVMGTDGILHIIDKIIMPQGGANPHLGNIAFKTPGKEILLFGI